MRYLPASLLISFVMFGSSSRADADLPITMPASNCVPVKASIDQATMANNANFGVTAAAAFHVPALQIVSFPAVVCAMPREWNDNVTNVTVALKADAAGANGSTGASRYANCSAQVYYAAGVLASSTSSGYVNLAYGSSQSLNLPISFGVGGSDVYVSLHCYLWGITITSIKLQ